MTRFALLLLLCMSSCAVAPVMAADRPDKPSAWFCMKARAHRAQFQTDKAAEESALAQGASRADIAKAHRCPR